MGARQPRDVARELHHGRGDRLTCLRELGWARRRGAWPMEPPDAHKRLDRHVERPSRRAPEALGEREHRREIAMDVHGTLPGPAVQLAQIAGVVEQREPRLHPAQLRERGGAGIEPRLLRLGVHHQVHRLAHRPRPALDEHFAAGGPAGDKDRPESGADGPDELASAHGGSSPQAEAWAR